MKTIISAVIVLVCVVAGAFGGSMLKGGSDTPSSSTEARKEDDAHAKKQKDTHKADKKKKAHGDKHGKSGASDVMYYKFSREFVVPIMEGERVKSLVILHLNLEVDSEISQTLFTMEPKLRDNIMTTLIGLSNDGKTLERPTETESYETIRSMVLQNLDTVVASGIRNVLIVDMAKQDL